MPGFVNDYSQMDEQQPSLVSQYFGSPAKAWWTLQKGSLGLTFLNNKMWKKALAGEGIRLSGVVGFRGIALGKAAEGSKLARMFSPSHAVAGIMEGLGFKERAAKFREFGLFGNSTDKGASFLGRAFGGGISNTSKFTNIFAEDMTRMGRVGRWYGEVSSGKWGNRGRAVAKRRQSAIDRAVAGKTSMAFEEGFADAGAYGTKEAAELVAKDISKMKWVGRIARVGKLAGWATTAYMAFDIASSVGEAGMNVLSNAADRLESSLSKFAQRRTEFAGKVGIGFYTSRSGTERQRALSAAGRGYGESGLGNEAAYQHIDSTF